MLRSAHNLLMRDRREPIVWLVLVPKQAVAIGDSCVCFGARVCSVAGVQLEDPPPQKEKNNNERWVDGGERIRELEHNNRNSWRGVF